MKKLNDYGLAHLVYFFLNFEGGELNLALELNGWFILIVVIICWGWRTYKVYVKGNYLAYQEIITQLLFIYILSIGYLTMQPFHFQLPFTVREFSFDYHLFYNLRHMADGYFAYQLLYSVGNILLFVPLGILLPSLYKKTNNFILVGLIGLMTSITIEMVQALFTISRLGTVDDLVFNTIGTLLGYVFFRCLKLFQKRIVYFYSIQKQSKNI